MMKEPRIDIDPIRARARFAATLLGLDKPWSDARRYLNGRLRADRVQPFIDRHRSMLDAPPDAGDEAAQIRALTKRRNELMRQEKTAPLTNDQLLIITPAEIGQGQLNKAGAAELLKQLNAAIDSLNWRIHSRAARLDFAKLVIRLADVTDDHERARILEDAGILSDESRRRFLAEPAETSFDKLSTEFVP